MSHPIEGLMNTAMSSIKDMIDVDTIIGEPISTGIDTLIIPISKVSFGFAAGGSEFHLKPLEKQQDQYLHQRHYHHQMAIYIELVLLFLF